MTALDAVRIAANILGWPILQLSFSFIAVRINAQHFAHDNTLDRVRAWEPRFYRSVLHIRRWKRHLPDGAPWVGGDFRKHSLRSRDAHYLRRYLIETRRGEAAHWAMLACSPLFFLWNPPWAGVTMLVYGAAANLPCIAVQRYNRHILTTYLARKQNL